MPKVSICIPTYQQVTYLKKTLDSVLEQRFTDYEIIVTDDSTDDSVKNLLAGFDFNSKLRYFKNTPGLGSPGNWNYAIQQASGEYIKLLHHDDFFTSADSLENYVSMLDENPEANFAFSGTFIKLLSLNIIHKYTCSDKKLNKIIKNPNEFFFGNVIGAPSATIIRNNLSVLFDTNLKWLVDSDWYIRLIKKKTIVAHTKKALICTIHGSEGQITQSILNDKTIQIKEHVYLFGKLIIDHVELKKYSTFFQLLFHKYKIDTLKELQSICVVPEKLESFFTKVLAQKKKHIFFKKMAYWYKKTSFKDYLFIIKKRVK